jgi:hypothetical protein
LVDLEWNDGEHQQIVDCIPGGQISYRVLQVEAGELRLLGVAVDETGSLELVKHPVVERPGKNKKIVGILGAFGSRSSWLER